MPSVKQGSIKNHFLSLVRLPGIEHQSPRPLANTNHHANWSVCVCVCVYKKNKSVYIVTVPKIFIPGRKFIFRTCEVGAVWHLIPRKISPS